MGWITSVTLIATKTISKHSIDAEYNPSPRSGVYGGYQDWKERPGRFRSLGDGQVDFKKILSKLTQNGYSSWAVFFYGNVVLKI